MPNGAVMGADDIRRAIVRVAHEIVEQNGGAEGLILLGLPTRGVPIAQRICAAIASFEQVVVPRGQIDPTLYRDDLFTGRSLELHQTELPADVADAKIVLVDDVLYTGRTARAAIEAVMGFGRPRAIELAVLIDRGHRELPIRANYVGKNLPTARSEMVNVALFETDGIDEVTIERGPD